MIDHTAIGVGDIARSAAFYDAALEALGLRRVAQHPPDMGTDAVGYGVDYPIFWINCSPLHGVKQHTALVAKSRAAVDAFHAKALSAGGADNGKPGLRGVDQGYPPGYYAAFVLDPDGNNMEAVFRSQWLALSQLSGIDRLGGYLAHAGRYGLAVLLGVILGTVTGGLKEILGVISRAHVAGLSDLGWLILVCLAPLGGMLWILWFFDKFFGAWERRVWTAVAILVAGFWHVGAPPNDHVTLLLNRNCSASPAPLLVKKWEEAPMPGASSLDSGLGCQ
jgi:catechol 2,3-dioxygenase-like lactoylglutathione lyase family enzyme